MLPVISPVIPRGHWRGTHKTAWLLFVLLLGAGFVHAAALNSPAPKFTLMDSHHRKRSLTDYKGKVVFINFWASWCAPCQAELPELNRLAADYKGKKVQVLAINVDQDQAAARKLLARLGLTDSRQVILWDGTSNVVSAYNIESMPCSYIIDGRGIIRFTHSGFHRTDPVIWRQEIDRLETR